MIAFLLCFFKFHVPHKGVNPAECLYWSCCRCKGIQVGGLGIRR